MPLEDNCEGEALQPTAMSNHYFEQFLKESNALPGSITSLLKQYHKPKLLPETGLLILDACGTTVYTLGRRSNLKELLRYCRKNQIHVTISSDCSRKSIFNIPGAKILGHYIRAFYGRNTPYHLIDAPKESGLEGMFLKNLDLILQDFGKKPYEAFMVGDHPITDGYSAAFAGIPFHLINHFGDFDFTRLIPENYKRPDFSLSARLH